MHTYLYEIPRNVSSCDVQPPCEMGQSKSFINRTYMCNTISRVYHNSSQQTCQTEDITRYTDHVMKYRKLFKTNFHAKVLSTIKNVKRRFMYIISYMCISLSDLRKCDYVNNCVTFIYLLLIHDIIHANV